MRDELVGELERGWLRCRDELGGGGGRERGRSRWRWRWLGRGLVDLRSPPCGLALRLRSLPVGWRRWDARSSRQVLVAGGLAPPPPAPALTAPPMVARALSLSLLALTVCRWSLERC
jgi:hypothetical protein